MVAFGKPSDPEIVGQAHRLPTELHGNRQWLAREGFRSCRTGTAIAVFDGSVPGFVDYLVVLNCS